jgi:two-component system sensor histidine kinase UhpB
LISDLRPSHLDDLGLAATLRWYAGEVEERAKLNVKVQISGAAHPLPPEVKTGLFRIAQEALTNVIKHADATEASLRLAYGDGEMVLEVNDNGIGFDARVLSMELSRPSWGLMGMEERATEMGGEFMITSKPGEGTLVRVEIPYPEESGVDDGDTTDPGG